MTLVSQTPVAFVLLILLVGSQVLQAQEQNNATSYIGVAFGTSFPLGDFKDTDITNPDAGFAENGRRIDLFGGYFLNEKVTLVGTLRYQSFDTGLEDIMEGFREDNPGVEFMGSSKNWQAYYLLLGLAYRVKVGKRINLFPRVSVGPVIGSNPSITVNAPNTPNSNGFDLSSETGVGVGYEVGIGLQRNSGRHFTLLPTFTISGGFLNINDIRTTTNNVIVTRDYQPFIQSFNLGLSLGYRFY